MQCTTGWEKAWHLIVFIGAMVVPSLDAVADDKCGPYDGIDLANNRLQLEEIIAAHKDWLSASKRSDDDPRRADLCGAILSKADLREVNLFGARLIKANLSEAVLTRANLGNAKLGGANLAYAELLRADLSDANLYKADLSNVNLFHANLANAYLFGANISGAKLLQANLANAEMSGVNLANATLGGADLSNANLWSADLSSSKLVRADMSNSNLRSANLSNASLVQTSLENAKVTDVVLTNARYEPGSAPSTGHLSGIKGVSTLWFEKGNQGGLVLLRTAVREAGLRELEREATYAIEHGKSSYAPWLEKWLNLIFLELTSGYGLYYGRPILILFSLIAPFAVVYYFAIAGFGASRLYRVWPEERIEGDEPTGKPQRRVEPLVIDPREKPFSTIGFALYFSLLSAFRIGWRELNFGSWIVRIQPREYTLQAIGWVRTVSGIQSLISIYLLALWVLVYFGRPFD